MRYFVTFDEFGSNEKKPTAVGIEPDDMSLDEAVERARQLFNEKRNNVTIRNDAGKSISGADLIECCEGTKLLTADLRAISN